MDKRRFSITAKADINMPLVLKESSHILPMHSMEIKRKVAILKPTARSNTFLRHFPAKNELLLPLLVACPIKDNLDTLVRLRVDN